MMKGFDSWLEGTMGKGVLALLGAAACGGMAACSDISVPDSRPTRISLEVDRTERNVGQEFVFTYEGEGRGIVGLVLTFGDGRVDSIPALGAQTVGGFREHAFQEAGVFEVRILMQDLGDAVAEDAVNVEVTDPAGSAPF
jgi:hypothetical protein